MATYAAPSMMAAEEYLRGKANDGDVIVVESVYQKAKLESLAAGLGLSVRVEVKRK